MRKYQCCGAGAAFFRLVPVLTQFGRSRLRDLGLSEPPKKIGGSATMVFTQDVYDCTAKNATDVYNGQLDIQIFGRDSNGQYSIPGNQLVRAAPTPTPPIESLKKLSTIEFKSTMFSEL